jgi:hypothetical protein
MAGRSNHLKSACGCSLAGRSGARLAVMLVDLALMNDALAAQAENEWRAHEAARGK